MIITINGRVLPDMNGGPHACETAMCDLVPDPGDIKPTFYPVLSSMRRVLLPVTAGLSILSKSTILLAATPAGGVTAGLLPIVYMIQDFAFPVGLGIGIWGLIEYMLDNPAGKEKVKKAVVGYIGIFVLPSIFTAIRDAFSK